ncbi:hypothetical protein RCL_jg22118.t1 [Rhizophagus clarus]|uniref:Uncharacterized protein n=1 Tax=Rhizophagus clarus TaxID=94130 RepID=A0A8H3LJV8_9GLOM|nr:hypothetical protein RCL_jg22118.t1 [Rhizophagus clarus]
MNIIKGKCGVKSLILILNYREIRNSITVYRGKYIEMKIRVAVSVSLLNEINSRSLNEFVQQHFFLN